MAVVQEWHQVSKFGNQFIWDLLFGMTSAKVLAAVSRFSFLPFLTHVFFPTFIKFREFF